MGHWLLVVRVLFIRFCLVTFYFFRIFTFLNINAKRFDLLDSAESRQPIKKAAQTGLKN
ncbi:hypothetical protein AU14_14340 [Marinobacter similis]|uniref:Uncharacterized protein n=1 Tax=Marinobacter similis TaxID=1420916 RepID=W5YMB2_9GAMM|nr:hypothetical protein AU14_14340 [Marinobacter similis]